MSHTEFRTGLATLGFHMTDEEFKKFVVAYDKRACVVCQPRGCIDLTPMLGHGASHRLLLLLCADNSGHVTFDQFNDAIGEFIQPRPTDGLVLQNRAPTPRLAAWVEPMFLQKALVMHELKQSQLSELFDVMDPYGAGAIPRARLVQAIRNVGIEGAESDWMAELYPADSNGRITKDVFVTRASEQVKLPGRAFVVCAARAGRVWCHEQAWRNPSSAVCAFMQAPALTSDLRCTRSSRAPHKLLTTWRSCLPTLCSRVTEQCCLPSASTSVVFHRLQSNHCFCSGRCCLPGGCLTNTRFDEDHNGVVSRAEFRAALASMGFHMTDHQFDNFFRLFDHNHSGAIDFEQFRETIGDVIQPTERRKHEVRPRSHQPGLHEWILRTMQKAVRSHFSDPTEVRAFVETCAGDDGVSLGYRCARVCGYSLIPMRRRAHEQALCRRANAFNSWQCSEFPLDFKRSASSWCRLIGMSRARFLLRSY